LNGELFKEKLDQETGDLAIDINDYEEIINFDMIKLGKYKIVLGIPWLSKHNPEINWKTNKIQFTQCECIKRSETIGRDIEFQGTRLGNQVKPRIKPKGKITKQNKHKYKKIKEIMAT
jgi:hypothetical protein